MTSVAPSHLAPGPRARERANQADSPPWVYTPERYDRLEKTQSVRVYGGIDIGGLPTLRAQPCRAESRGPRWFVYSASTQWQGMLHTADEAYALYGFGEQLRDLSHRQRAEVVENLLQAGRDLLASLTFVPVVLEGRRKFIAPNRLAGCIFCGEPSGIEFRKDKYGRIFPHAFCKTLVFLDHSLQKRELRGLKA